MPIEEFIKLVRHDGKRHFRAMSWRIAEPDGSYDAYKILVSEMMLQQTLVSRVMPKFESFLAQFPTVHDLADAPLADVLRIWSGLGYNRRAKYLHEAAKVLASSPQPWTLETLTSCKGIGQNTAKAVRVYAYDAPEVFIETNIRTVFIHYFFPNAEAVKDADILNLLERSLTTKNPRSFYWALMDIGAYIKSTTGNVSQKSAVYKKQAAFQGSLRQIRGHVLKQLADGPQTFLQLQAGTDERLTSVLHDLQDEELIHSKAGHYHLGSA